MPKQSTETKNNTKEDLSFHYLTNSILTGLIIITFFARVAILIGAAVILRVVQNVRINELEQDASMLTVQVLNCTLVTVLFLVLSMGLTHLLVKKNNKKYLMIEMACLGLLLAVNLIKLISVL